MKTMVRRTCMATMLVWAALAVAACGSVQVQVEQDPQGQEALIEMELEDTSSLDASEPTEQIVPQQEEAGGPLPVVAWYGRVVSLPDGSEFDDFLVIYPEGVGAVGLAGVNANLEAQIQELRDKEEPSDKAHFWGTLTCEVPDYNRCQVLVDRIRPDGPGAMFDPDPVEAWEGFITSGPSGPRSGGDDYFTLMGSFDVQYGIWSEDEALAGQLEALRDTGKVFRVWGRLIAGIPDWSGTQIQVERIEEVAGGSVQVPEATDENTADPGMVVYTNDRYGYQFSYPTAATLTKFGPIGFPSDELPQGTSAEEFLAQIEKLFGDQLCVQVEYGLGYLVVSAAPNQGQRYVPCGRTGTSAGEVSEVVESVTLGEEVVQAKGMVVTVDSDSTGVLSESYWIRLPDGTTIEYGSRPEVSSGTYEDYLVKGKPMLLQILASFTILP